MNAQAFPDRTPLPEKAIRQKRPPFPCGPGCMADDRPERRERIAFFPYTPVSDRIRTFVALLSHAGQPAGIRIPVQRISGFQTNDPDKTSPAFPAGKRVLPFFLFSSGSPPTGIPDPERQKNHCESAGPANFSPIPQKSRFAPRKCLPSNSSYHSAFSFPVASVFCRQQAFPLKTRRFRRTTNRFLSPETPVWPVLAGKANAFSMSIGPPFKSRRPALCLFPGIRTPVRIMSGISSVSQDS